MKKEISMLIKWLARPGNTATYIATSLGYHSSTTINQWIRRGNIPDYQLKRVLELIKK